MFMAVRIIRFILLVVYPVCRHDRRVPIDSTFNRFALDKPIYLYSGSV